MTLAVGGTLNSNQPTNHVIKEIKGLFIYYFTQQQQTATWYVSGIGLIYKGILQHVLLKMHGVKITLYTNHIIFGALLKFYELTSEPPRWKTNNVVSEQVRHKPACTSTEKS